MSSYLIKQIDRALVRSEKTLSGPVFGRRRIETRMLLKGERRRGVIRLDRLSRWLNYQKRRRKEQWNARVAMIDHGDGRFLRILVRLAERTAQFELRGLLDNRRRLLGAGDLPCYPDENVCNRKANGEQPAQRTCNQSPPMAHLPFHRAYG